MRNAPFFAILPCDQARFGFGDPHPKALAPVGENSLTGGDPCIGNRTGSAELPL
ncbi:MAG: hypothetical protein P8M25_09795 [Paracoccaceae bacterium]|nr:hypothetical protein [Paracoccaceae bacterium]